MRNRLGAVDEGERARTSRGRGDRLDRVDRAEGVRLMSDRQQLDALELPLEPIEQEEAVVVDAEELEPSADFLCEQLPWHEVAVMLHLGQQDPVARLDIGSPPAVAHEVDRLGGIAGEDDLLYGGGVDEAGHSPARRLVGGRRLLAQGVDAPMGVGVVPPVVIVHRVDHRRRFLRGGGAIEVDQRLAMDLPSQDREVSLDGLGV